MAGIPKFLEGAAFGILNDILAGYRDDNGYAQPNKYEVMIFPPAKRGGGNNTNMFSGMERQTDLRKLSLRAQSVNLPGRNLSTSNDTNIYGPEREIVEGVTYAEEISIDFQASSELTERVFFENWQRQAFNETTWNIGYYNDYVGSVQIHSLDEQDNKVYGVELVEAFPKAIGQQALAYGQGNNYQTLSVTFSYRYWKNLTDEANLPKPLLDRIAERAVNTVTRRITSQIPSVLRRL